MPFSSVLGASSAIKPGVCTSSTRPSAPYVGQLIFETDTNRLAAYNGSAWVTQNGLQLIKTQTIGSAVSSVTVSDVFSNTFANYRIVVSNVDASTNNTGIFWQLGATTSGYYSSEYYDAYTGASTGVNRRSNAASWEVGVGNSDDMTTIIIDVYSPNLAMRTQFTGMFQNALYSGWAGGYQDSLTQFTSFLFAPGGGTLTGGSVRVYGYANN
jgi:hypothetical protein